MTIDKSIFGLRFGANVEIYPAREELQAFLESPKHMGHWEPHADDLSAYGAMLEAVSAFEHHRRQEAGPRDCREVIFYGVLSHSCFFNAVLKSDVEYFKYHAHSLLTLDFKKPTVFIRNAEEEILKNSTNKKNDPARLARLRSMVNERVAALEALKKRRAILFDELKHIARYIRDNLVKIEKLCETSIVVLADPKIAKREENRHIEDVKEYFQESLREELHQSAVTKPRLEAVKDGMDAASRELSDLIREDIYALSRLYESIYDHASAIVRKVDALMAEINSKKGLEIEEIPKIYVQLEQVVVSLISDFHFELEPAAAHPDTAYTDFLLSKRKEMIDLLFKLLLKERRARRERRTFADRRKVKETDYKGPERRTGKERRTRKSRRH